MGSEWRPAYGSQSSSSATMNHQSSSYSNTSRYEEPQESDRHSYSSTAETSEPRWYEASEQPRNTSKVVVSSQEIRQIIAGAVGGKLAEDFRLFLGDNTYYLPSVEDAVEIINNSGLSRATYMPESFDCDDFAIVLKSHFCEAAYKDRERRPPHCFGMIWGELPHVHAINWMINADYRLRLIEPQTGQVFEPAREHRNITFMMA